jgi:hypothetical protein
VAPDLKDVYFSAMLSAGRSIEADEATMAVGAAS